MNRVDDAIDVVSQKWSNLKLNLAGKIISGLEGFADSLEIVKTKIDNLIVPGAAGFVVLAAKVYIAIKAIQLLGETELWQGIFNRISGLMLTEAAFLRLGQAGILAGAAIAAWNLGGWLRDTIPWVKAFGDAVADLALEYIPGLAKAIDYLQERWQKLSFVPPSKDLAKRIEEVTTALRAQGVQFETQGSRTLPQYASYLADIKNKLKEIADAFPNTSANRLVDQFQRGLGQGLEGMERRLSNLQEQKRKIDTEITKTKEPESPFETARVQGAINRYNETAQQIEQVKEEIRLFNGLRAAQEAAHASYLRAVKEEQTELAKFQALLNGTSEIDLKQIEGLTKATETYTEAIAKSKAEGQYRGTVPKELRLAFEADLQAVFIRNFAERIKLIEEEGKKYREFYSERLKQELDLQAQTIKIRLDTSESALKFEETVAANTRDAQLRAAEAIIPQTLASKIRLEVTKSEIESTYVQKSLQIKLDAIEREAEAEKQLFATIAQLDPRLQPAVAERTAAIDAATREKRRQLEISAADDIAKAKEEAAIRADRIIIESNQKVFDTFKREAEGTLDAMFTKSKNIFEALGNSLKSIFLTAIKDIVSSRIAASLTELVTGQRVRLEPQTPRAGPLGRIASAIGLGAQPVFGGTRGNIPITTSRLGAAVPVVVANPGDLTPSGPGSDLEALARAVGTRNIPSAAERVINETINRQVRELTENKITNTVTNATKNQVENEVLNRTLLRDEVNKITTNKTENEITNRVVNLTERDVLERIATPVTVSQQLQPLKLEQAGHLGDMRLSEGSVPVVVRNLPSPPKEIPQTAGSPGGLATTIGGLAGTLGGLTAVMAAAGEKRTEAVSQTIDYGAGKQDLGGVTRISPGGFLGKLSGLGSLFGMGANPAFALGPGGTSGFAGPLGNILNPPPGVGAPITTPPFVGNGPAGGGGLGGILGNLKGTLGGLKDFLGFGGGVQYGAGQATTFGAATLGQKLSALGRSNAALFGGATLALDGLRRGGLAGFGETVAGGALIGNKFLPGGIGAAIGAGVGAIAGLFGIFRKSKAQQIMERVQSLYRISISKSFAGELGKIIDANYGGDIERGLRATPVMEQLQLYAQSHGQDFPLTFKPYNVGLDIAGGTLYQRAASVNGSLVAYGGGTAKLESPVDKLIMGTERTGSGAENQPTQLVVQNLSLSLNGDSAAKALRGEIANASDQVATANLQAMSNSANRREITATQNTPGLLLA